MSPTDPTAFSPPPGATRPPTLPRPWRQLALGAAPAALVPLGLALGAVATATLALPLPSVAGELGSAQALEQLCGLSDPEPSAEAAAAAVMLSSLGNAPALSSSTRSAARRVYAGQRATALLDTWRVDVPAGSLIVADEDTLLDELVLGAWEPLVIDPASGHGVALDQALVTLHCAPGRTADASLAHAAGLVRLELELQLPSALDPTQPFCTASELADEDDATASHRLVLDGQLLHARLVHTGSDEVLCQTSTPRASEREVRFAQRAEGEPWLAQVEVTRVDLMRGDATVDASARALAAAPPGEDEPIDATRVSALRNEIESALMPCYQATLCRSGQRQGALTIRASVRDTSIENPAVTVDALDSEPIASCALRQLEALELGERLPATDLGLVVIFRLSSTAPRSTTAAMVESLERATRSAVAGASGTPR